MTKEIAYDKFTKETADITPKGCFMCGWNECEEILLKKIAAYRHIIECLRYGCDPKTACYCDVSIGDPRMSDHSTICKMTTQFLKENK